MTPEQADAILDAVIHCRATSRQLSNAAGPAEVVAAIAADDAAYRLVGRLVREATNGG